jgi:DNA-binding NarL/FixJ family response regulator
MRRHTEEDLDQNTINWTHVSAKTRGGGDSGPNRSAKSPQDASGGPRIVIIEKRLLLGECLARCMKLASGHSVISFPTVESWLQVADTAPASLIILCWAGNANASEVQSAVSLLSQSANRLPTIVVSDVEDPQQIINAIENGVRGYIPTSVPLQVAIEAMHLVQAGGVFVPASSLMAATRSSPRTNTPGTGTPKEPSNRLFTTRQAAVVEALRRGKANKIIAHELNMRESTVKVHVRNIMKKLKARNRTEVAFMTNSLGQTQVG